MMKYNSKIFARYMRSYGRGYDGRRSYGLW